jgi:hypothetical protein
LKLDLLNSLFDSEYATIKIGRYFMFPESQDSPAILLQEFIYFAISFPITFDLVKPVLLIGFEGSLSLTSPPITVPKIAITEDRNATSDKYEVWLPHDRVLFSITKSSLPKRRPKLLLDRRPT